MEIQNIEKGLDRMENKALMQQRVVLSEEKSDNMSKLALGAKLERALDRRMTGQDAVMRKKASPPSEREAVNTDSHRRSTYGMCQVPRRQPL